MSNYLGDNATGAGLVILTGKCLGCALAAGSSVATVLAAPVTLEGYVKSKHVTIVTLDENALTRFEFHKESGRSHGNM